MHFYMYTGIGAHAVVWPPPHQLSGETWGKYIHMPAHMCDCVSILLCGVSILLCGVSILLCGVSILLCGVSILLCVVLDKLEVSATDIIWRAHPNLRSLSQTRK